ncbi:MULTISPECIES: GNAT family N-acetyltransferase [Methylomonas]|uniref:Acetyltransferase n=1 Tax=Methylomonas koyamae TaxID=702114 RepID=A0A177NBV2_9GAMM|nr:GNAT family N-acetyltransferase [Methylomonas koyamae]OAI15352.1 acetyltransferase [Methylomonas koyamae]
MKSFSVRQATLSDLDALVPLFDGYRRFYGKPSDPHAAKSFLRDRLEHGESVLFLAEQDNSATGFVQLYPSFSSVSLARTYILNDLFVDAGFRRQGIAGRLMAAAVEYAATLGAVRLSLSTAAINTEAQALYRRTGWTRDEQFYVYHLPIPAIEPLNG